MNFLAKIARTSRSPNGCEHWRSGGGVPCVELAFFMQPKIRPVQEHFIFSNRAADRNVREEMNSGRDRSDSGQCSANADAITATSLDLQIYEPFRGMVISVVDFLASSAS